MLYLKSWAGAVGWAVIASGAVAGAPAGQNAAAGDLDFARPPARSEAGLPIGNGRMGSLVWTDPQAVHLQINRVDVFGVGGASRSFPQRSTDYCGGCAGVEIDFGGGAEAFPRSSTTERLACADGLATVTGKDVEVRALAWADGDVLALEVTDRRAQPQPIEVRLRRLRPAVVTTRFHTARSDFAPGIGGVPVLTQSFTEDTYYCGSAVALALPGGTAVGNEGVRTSARHFIVYVSSAASFAPSLNLAAAANRSVATAEALGFAGLKTQNDAWWARFWAGSNVRLHSADGVADRIEGQYAYFLYIMAASSRGDYPAKFNGMLWNTAGDVRRWGAAYWGANQSCYYNNALFAANHGDLMEPMFTMYSRMVPAEERAAREEWGSEGIYFPETVTFDGLAPLPADVAAEMRELYVLRKPWAERSERFKAYAAEMQPYTSRWNFINGGAWENGRWVYTERGSGPYGPTSHILSRGAKIAYQYWQRYEYTQDRGWLRDRAYPVIKGVAEFCRHFPTTLKGSDGRWHIGRVNSNEGLWGGRDTDEEIASMRAIFPVLIRASRLLGVDAELRPQWQEFLADLGPLPRSDLPDVYQPLSPGGPPVWQRSFLPVVMGRGSLPDGNTLPMWFFDFCSLEAPAAIRATAGATLDAMTTRRRPPATPAAAASSAPARRIARGGVGVLSKLPLAQVELGRVSGAREGIVRQMFGGETPILENRMDLREGEQTMGIERLGNAADALHTALCLDLPAGPGEAPVIRVFPAWPPEWDAKFTLLCRGNFLVTAAQRGGVTLAVRIVAQSGGECRLRNPWSTARISRAGGPPMASAERLLLLQTAPGESIELSAAAP